MSAVLEDLLRAGVLRKGPLLPAEAPSGPPPLSTGVAALDEALGGGLHRGQLAEIVAPASAGGTALLRAALGAATRRGELCALIDPDDAFDPDPARLDLRRLLWVRPASIALALRAAEIALEARFALVALDLAGEPQAAVRKPPADPFRERAHRVEQAILLQPQLRLDAQETVQRIDRDLVRAGRPRAPSRPQPGGSPWARLARRAERHGGTLLVLSRWPQAGTFAGAAVELSRVSARWAGVPGTAGRLLLGAVAVGAVVRSRRVRPSGGIPLALPWN